MAESRLLAPPSSAGDDMPPRWVPPALMDIDVEPLKEPLELLKGGLPCSSSRMEASALALADSRMRVSSSGSAFSSAKPAI